MLNFKTKSSKGNALLKYKEKLFSRSKFAVDGDNRITKCYWSCISSQKGCKAKVSYCIDVAVAGDENDGMGAGIYNINEKPHTEEYCDITRTDIVHRRARNRILNRATEGQLQKY
jgi:hypothetical protein